MSLKQSIEDAEKGFNQLSIEERGKFDEETLVNVNSIRKRRSTSQRSNGFRNEYIVVRSTKITCLKIHDQFLVSVVFVQSKNILVLMP